jgi:hypothetical protein
VSMQQAQAHVEDSRLDSERRIRCKGSALIRFEYLKWNEYIRLNAAKRRPDKERVERLKRRFQKAGCRPEEKHHHIPALVDQRELNVALENARQKGRWKTDILPSTDATINDQEGYPELDLPGGVECLDGFHRIQAGKEWLLPGEKWWIVDLYLSDISYQLKTILNEQYWNKETPCDGEIYRKIRQYQSRSSPFVDSQISPSTCVSFENLWWARLEKSREKKLRRLLGKSAQNQMLAAGFDALSKIPGLFDSGMMVTTLHKVMATKCYEVSTMI